MIHEGRGERQLRLPFVQNGNCNFLLSTKGHEGHEELQLLLLFVHEGPRRATKDHEELQRQNCNCNFFLFMEGREELLYLILEGREENHLRSPPEILGLGHENLAGEGPILFAGA